jgi:hypothetical protein
MENILSLQNNVNERIFVSNIGQDFVKYLNIQNNVNERIIVRKNNIAAWASYEKINIYKI